MQPEHISVGNLFAGEWTYTVPLFQRPYVWDSARWEPLWEDVVRVAEEACRGSPKVRPHFLGSVVLQQRATKITEGPRREVIDGQQRLTTLQLLLKAVADVLGKDAATADTARSLSSLLRNEFAPPADTAAAFKVWPTNVDRDRYRAVMLGDGTAKPIEGDRIAAGYAYFRNAAARWLAEDAEARTSRSLALSATIRQRLWLIALNLTADDQAQVIFETLNARGTPLLPADLVKNLLLRRAEEENADAAALYEKYWRPFDTEELYWRKNVGRGHAERPRVDLFLIHFLTAKVQNVIPSSQLYEHFSDYLKDAGDRGASEHLSEIAQWAAMYRELEAAEETGAGRLGLCAARLRAMDFMTAMPVLLYLRTDPDRSSGDADQAAVWIESFLVRRMVCGLNTRGYNALFPDLLRAVAEARDLPAATTVAAFLRRSQAEAGLWPDDAQFGAAWRTQPVYRTLKRDRLTMLLRGLERALREPKHDPVPIPKTLHVEHLMPQNWGANWPLPPGTPEQTRAIREAALHTIGNLTLLTGKHNQALSDGTWDQKRAGLRQFGLMALNAALATQERWDESTIRARSDQLFERALTLWPRPA